MRKIISKLGPVWFLNHNQKPYKKCQSYAIENAQILLKILMFAFFKEFGKPELKDYKLLMKNFKICILQRLINQEQKEIITFTKSLSGQCRCFYRKINDPFPKEVTKKNMIYLFHTSRHG